MYVVTQDGNSESDKQQGVVNDIEKNGSGEGLGQETRSLKTNVVQVENFSPEADDQRRAGHQQRIVCTGKSGSSVSSHVLGRRDTNPQDSSGQAKEVQCLLSRDSEDSNQRSWL